MKILFEDEEIIVCHKPAGLATQTAKLGEKDIMSELRNYLSDGTGKEPYVGLIHRLDQGVEGILVFAKTHTAAADLSKQVTEHTMKKYYYAMVSGEVKEQTATLVDYLIKDVKTNTSRVVPKGMQGAKRAELIYTVLKQRTKAEQERIDVCNHHKSLNLLEVELITGRHHQIRVQLSNQGLPLVNDYKYGYHDNTTCDTGVIKGQRIALCAYKLRFFHPTTHKPITFEIKPLNSIFDV